MKTDTLTLTAPTAATSKRPAADVARVNAQIIRALPAIEGWCTERKALWLAGLIADYGCGKILEIGVYGGKSLIPMALALRTFAPAGKVYGVEGWSGEVATRVAMNAEHDTWWRSVDFKRIKSGFVRNVLDNDLADIVNVLEMSSDDAFKCLNAIHWCAFDLIHIDGSHTEAQALSDVRMWTGLLRPGGILVMDDINWPTVQAARDYVKSTFVVIDEVFEPEGAVAYGAYQHGVAA